jgi:hypothetical protein
VLKKLEMKIIYYFRNACDLDLEGFEDKDQDGEPTGIKLPYIVTIRKG